jgi:hypothetical protein
MGPRQLAFQMLVRAACITPVATVFPEELLAQVYRGE